ncbi:hypothetical protein APHAL10511_001606 [Amanita phalloides]|nr:hypothetical protein APHAL10511_001606 [Amanita phalloides]
MDAGLRLELDNVLGCHRLDMQSCIQNALDELLSPRSQADAKTNALEELEHQLALACLNNSHTLNHFNSLQRSFECNIPLRVLTWISITTPKLDSVIEKGRENDVLKMVSQLSLALSIIQGTVLIHHASKVYLGRKHALEILLDLLLVSRHVPQRPLSSIVLDTLLCILVDAPNSIRSFENANGVQSVVKILKRAGTPREVRMKCLEFLYFYLLDETPELDVIPTAPSTPVHVRKKPYLSPGPMLPSSRQVSSSSVTLVGSRSASSESLVSMTSASTAPSSLASSPDNTSVTRISPQVSVVVAPTAASPLTRHSHISDDSPLPEPSISPKFLTRHQIGLKHSPSKGMLTIPKPYKSWNEEPEPLDGLKGRARLVQGVGSEKTKSTEEKKELLGTMLGNVDALVESVRKAGIWGLS